MSTDYPILRQALARFFGNDHRLIAHFELQAKEVDETSSTAASTAEATEKLQDATVIVLSANQAFTNERLLRRGAGVRMVDTGVALIIEVDEPLRALTDPAGLGNYVDDVAAAAGGVEIGSFYRNGSVLMARIA